MTEPSEAAKAKAVEMLHDGAAIALFIQQVSDAAKKVEKVYGAGSAAAGHLAPFILPETLDPVEEAIKASIDSYHGFDFPDDLADDIVKQIAKRGLKIVEDSQ